MNNEKNIHFNLELLKKFMCNRTWWFIILVNAFNPLNWKFFENGLVRSVKFFHDQRVNLHSFWGSTKSSSQERNIVELWTKEAGYVYVIYFSLVEKVNYTVHKSSIGRGLFITVGNFKVSFESSRHSVLWIYFGFELMNESIYQYFEEKIYLWI